MKTKNIFKTVAFAMLMPTMLLTTSCSSEDDLVNNTAENTETVANKGYALPVTVSATRQSDGTRATFDGSKLNFSTGDKLFVEGSHVEADRFAGTLDYVPATGKFSGTIYTESLYKGTIDDLLNGNYATLLPAGYESYDYLEIMDEGYEAHLGENAWNSFVTSKKLAVEQLSFEHGEYTSGTGFVLEPRNAILNFTITGLTPSTKVTAALSDDEDWTPDIEGEVTTDGSGNATFAIGLEGSSDLNEFSLTVASNPVTLVNSSKTLTAGKIYNISRSAAPATPALNITSPSVGQVIGSDGKNYAYGSLPSGVTAVAKICYVSGSNGLAIALADEASKMNWSTAQTTCAAHTPAFTGGTWKLASQDEWDNMISAAGSYTDLRDGFSSVGGTNMQSDDRYWSSTETEPDSNYAWVYNFSNGKWGNGYKDFDYYVRACLAF